MSFTTRNALKIIQGTLTFCHSNLLPLFFESEKEVIAIFENIANVVNMTYFIFASLEIYSIRFALSPNLNKKIYAMEKDGT